MGRPKKITSNPETISKAPEDFIKDKGPEDEVIAPLGGDFSAQIKELEKKLFAGLGDLQQLIDEKTVTDEIVSRISTIENFVKETGLPDLNDQLKAIDAKFKVLADFMEQQTGQPSGISLDDSSKNCAVIRFYGSQMVFLGFFKKSEALAFIEENRGDGTLGTGLNLAIVDIL